MVLASVSVALGKLSPMTKLENIVSFEPWSCVGMLTPGLPSWSVSAGLPTASWPTVMLKLGRLTGSPTVRFCTGDVWSFTSNAVMLVGMLTTRLPSVVAVLTRQNSRCDVTVPPLVELKMRRTMSMFAALALMSGTETVPVVVTCDANVPFKSVGIVVDVVDVVVVVVVVVEDVVITVVGVVVEDVVITVVDVVVEGGVVEDVVVGVVPPLRTSMAASAVASRAAQLDVWTWQSFLLFALVHPSANFVSALASFLASGSCPFCCPFAMTLSFADTFLATAFVTPASQLDCACAAPSSASDKIRSPPTANDARMCPSRELEIAGGEVFVPR